MVNYIPVGPLTLLLAALVGKLATMSDVVIAALIAGGFGVFGSIAGVWISNHYALKRDKISQRRWFAEYVLPRKIETFCELHTTLQSCISALNQYERRFPSSIEEYEKVIGNSQKYSEKLTVGRSFIWRMVNGRYLITRSDLYGE